jgi:hypothetical protein
MSTDTLAFPSGPNAALYALLASADLVTIDGGPYIHTWEISHETGEPNNEVILFIWFDEGISHACILTEGGIGNGQIKEDFFACFDHEGEPVAIRFYKAKEINPQSIQGDSPPFPVLVHARRLIEKVDRANELRKGGKDRIATEDWTEMSDIANDLRVALERV